MSERPTYSNMITPALLERLLERAVEVPEVPGLKVNPSLKPRFEALESAEAQAFIANAN